MSRRRDRRRKRPPKLDEAAAAQFAARHAERIEQRIIAGENRLVVEAPGDNWIVVEAPSWRRQPIRRLRLTWARCMYRLRP